MTNKPLQYQDDQNGTILYAKEHQYNEPDLALKVIDDTIGYWLDSKSLDAALDFDVLKSQLELVYNMDTSNTRPLEIKYPFAACVSLLDALSDKTAPYYWDKTQKLEDIFEMSKTFFQTIPGYGKEDDVTRGLRDISMVPLQRYLASYAKWRAGWGEWDKFEEGSNDHLDGQYIVDTMPSNFHAFVNQVWSEKGGMKMSVNDINQVAVQIITAINHSVFAMVSFSCSSLQLKNDVATVDFKDTESGSEVASQMRNQEYAEGAARIYSGGAVYNREMYLPMHEYMNGPMIGR